MKIKSYKQNLLAELNEFIEKRKSIENKIEHFTNSLKNGNEFLETYEEIRNAIGNEALSEEQRATERFIKSCMGSAGLELDDLLWKYADYKKAFAAFSKRVSTPHTLTKYKTYSVKKAYDYSSEFAEEWDMYLEENQDNLEMF